MRQTSLFMSGLFFLAAVVQHNDPDPIGWALLYGTAGICSFLYWRSVRIRIVAFPLTLVAVFWALALAVGEAPAFPPAEELFGQYVMTGDDVEVIREIGGLVLVSIWMAVIGLNEERNPD